MATNSTWTVVFEDKSIMKQSGDAAGTLYTIDNDSFWNNSKWSNVWAIQYIDDNHDYNDSVEYRDDTSHATWTDSGLGDFRTQFVSLWDTAHLTALQSAWDEDTIVSYENNVVVSTETEAEKIARLGARPTSYSSY